MNPFVQGLITAGVRAALQAASGFLVAKGIQGQDNETIIGALGIGLSFLWSAFSKHKDTQRQVVAQSSPNKLTLEQVDAKISAGNSPSVMTAKDTIPVSVMTVKE